MRARNHTDGADEDRIINAESDTSDYLKSVIDAKWRRQEWETSETAE